MSGRADRSQTALSVAMQLAEHLKSYSDAVKAQILVAIGQSSAGAIEVSRWLGVVFMFPKAIHQLDMVCAPPPECPTELIFGRASITPDLAPCWCGGWRVRSWMNCQTRWTGTG